MDWRRFSRGHRLDPVAGVPPEAVVILLHDRDQPTALLAVAARWAPTVPTTAFVAFDGIGQLDVPACDRQGHTLLELDAAAGSMMRDSIARHLESLIAEQQRYWRLDTTRFVLVGFRYGGTAALRLVLRQGWRCAGVLAFSPGLMQPLPRTIRSSAKIRLVESVESRDASHADVRADVASLTARGIDARGVLLAGSAVSDEAIRYGGAYLVELIATAQRSDRFHDLDAETQRS
jgi:predicted esterase